MRESALQFLVQKKHDALFNLLKDDASFSELMQDDIFTRIFFENFDDLFKSENSETNIGILYSFHKSKDYAFSLPENEHLKVLKFLINKTEKYDYAKLLPDYEVSIKIIKKYRQEIKKKAEEEFKLNQKNSLLNVTEIYPTSKNFIKTIFNSEQEKEFYFACRNIFENEIILPNVSLTTIFNSKYVEENYFNHFQYFLKASVDFVIVNPKTFVPYLFFELDSKTYHSSTHSVYNDSIKDLFFKEFGKKLFRITKKDTNQGVNEFEHTLRMIKSEYEN